MRWLLYAKKFFDKLLYSRYSSLIYIGVLLVIYFCPYYIHDLTKTFLNIKIELSLFAGESLSYILANFSIYDIVNQVYIVYTLSLTLIFASFIVFALLTINKFYKFKSYAFVVCLFLTLLCFITFSCLEINNFKDFAVEYNAPYHFHFAFYFCIIVLALSLFYFAISVYYNKHMYYFNQLQATIDECNVNNKQNK